jgi:DNA-binding MarR family transcriptional regulator
MRIHSRKKKDITSSPQIDTSYLQTLIGYNCRRAAVSVISLFLDRMAAYGLRPVDFSVLSLVLHNPGITSRQLCKALDLLPPNLVSIVNNFDNRGLIKRSPLQNDRRAIGLELTDQGVIFMAEAEQAVTKLEMDASRRLTQTQRRSLIKLLRLIYEPHHNKAG